MRYRFLLKYGLTLACAAGLLTGCNSIQKENDLFRGYDLSQPGKFNLPESLFEVSGIAFDKGKSDTIYAVQDEEGKLFRLKWDEPKQLHTTFGKKGDYEDVAILKNHIYILKSNGTIYSFPVAEAKLDEPRTVRELADMLPKGEYEGMFGDEKTGKLYVICKNCAGDDSKKRVSGYILAPGGDSTLAKAGSFQIQVGEIAAIIGEVKRGFRPSGIARNPVTGEWFIISAVNKLVVVTDPNWKVKDAHRLDGNRFVQPEGIAFDSAGNLYISNEGDDLFSGNVLQFKLLTGKGN